MLFQKEMRLQIHNEICPKFETELDTTEQTVDSGFTDQLLAARENAFKKAEMNILAAQKKQKETYDCKHEAKILPVGTLVLLENTLQKQRKGGKYGTCVDGSIYNLKRPRQGVVRAYP